MHVRESQYQSLVLSELRLATQAKHQVLDKTMPLAKEDADWSTYICHLQLLSRWLAPLEKWLSGFTDGPQGQDAVDFIYYSELIKKDLAEAGLLPDLEVQPIVWPASEEAAYRWGICYVIEGSQLGGEFLYQRLSTRLAPHSLHYLQQKQPGRWRDFLQSMAQSVTAEEQIAKACAGAADAFDALLSELREQRL